MTARRRTKPRLCWAVLWRSQCRLDGKTERLIGCPAPPWVQLFPTRRLAREFIAERYGYIRERPDLQVEPHGWKVPIPVKVRVSAERVDPR